jgi:hypothetical protein
MVHSLLSDWRVLQSMLNQADLSETRVAATSGHLEGAQLAQTCGKLPSLGSSI